jgi:D-alanyl-D-alanine carboxypeptidase
LAAAALLLAVPQMAEARSKHAAIVIDANTGKTLYASSADAERYPASLTKMMTLYLTFEALASGKIKKTTKVPFSAHAASMPPTKLGIKAGGSVSVETVIYSLVTKSANDAAAAIGELLAGSESEFAQVMTAKARRLGMNNTVFRNASGLPNSAQHTTARDMATLGIALREHYPQYYDYFSTRSFTYGRRRMGNHNHLLGRIKGVDGIKTGYTRASGFNLAASVQQGDRSIVAVVMGGASGRSRDNEMKGLIKKYLPKGSTRDRGQLVARSGGSGINPVAARMPKHDAPTPDKRPTIEVAATSVEPVAAQAYAAPTPASRIMDAVDPVKTASTVPSGWVVQVASSPSENDARKALEETSRQAPAILADASGYTVVFDNDGVTYYRARFGAFSSKSAAWNACGALKKKKIACYAVRQ